MHKTPTVNALSHTQDVSIYSKLTGTVDTEVSNSSAESLKVADKEIFDQYCGQVYTRKGMNDCRVHFVITKNLDAHRTVSILLVHTILDGIFSVKFFTQCRLWSSSIPGRHMSERIQK